MKRLNCTKGQALTEYIILVVLVAIISLSTVKILGNKIKGKIQDANQQIDKYFPDFSDH